MRKSIWNGAVFAESDCAVEGRHYFPREAVKREYLAGSPTETVWPWMGVHSDYTVDGEKNRDEARYCPTPKLAPNNITDHVPLWRGLTVVR